MKIYTMDRDYYALRQIDTLLAGSKYDLKCFSYLYQLTTAVEQDEPDVILIENEVPSLLGYAENIRKAHPDVKLVFVGKQDGFTAAQMNFRPDGRLVKPITKEALEQQLFRAMHPMRARMLYGKEGA